MLVIEMSLLEYMWKQSWCYSASIRADDDYAHLQH